MRFRLRKGSSIPLHQCYRNRGNKTLTIYRSEIEGFAFAHIYSDKGDVGLVLTEGQYNSIFYLDKTIEEEGRVIQWQLRCTSSSSRWAAWTMIINNDLDYVP